MESEDNNESDEMRGGCAKKKTGMVLLPHLERCGQFSVLCEPELFVSNSTQFVRKKCKTGCAWPLVVCKSL